MSVGGPRPRAEGSRSSRRAGGVGHFSSAVDNPSEWVIGLPRNAHIDRLGHSDLGYPIYPLDVDMAASSATPELIPRTR